MKVEPPLGDVEGALPFYCSLCSNLSPGYMPAEFTKAAKAGRKESGYSGHSASCPLIPQAKRLLNPTQGFPDDLAKLLPSIYPPAVISVNFQARIALVALRTRNIHCSLCSPAPYPAVLKTN